MMASSSSSPRKPWRLLVTLVIALVASTVFASAAHAAHPEDIDTERSASLVVHKREQPQAFGPPASGLVQDTAPGTPIPGVDFTAVRVPDVDLTTAAGWRLAREMTVTQAQRLTAAEPLVRSRTDGDGIAAFEQLPLGLYLVEETGAPPGVVPAPPFLVPLPIQHPVDTDTWLYDVHVYPKNSRADVTVSVEDSHAVTVGDAVGWTAAARIPRQQVIERFEMLLGIDERLRLLDGAAGIEVRLRMANAPLLQVGRDYEIDLSGPMPSIRFTEIGRQVLAKARADDPDAAVLVSYRTGVLAEGELTSEVTLLPTSDATVRVSDAAVTAFGPLTVEVQDERSAERKIPGAVLQLHLSAGDAESGRNPIIIEGADRWVTGADGRVRISGLRLSDLVDGQQRAEGDPLYRRYFVRVVSVPDPYQRPASAVPAVVLSTVDDDLLVIRLLAAAGGGPDLPPTGGQPGLLPGIGLLLIAGGILLAARRRRPRRDAAGPL